MTDSVTFSFHRKDPGTNASSTFKWYIGDDKYEIHACTLREIGIETLLPHCVDVPSKIRKELDDEDLDAGPSLFKVFPRTLSIPVCAAWDLLTAEVIPPLQTTERFDELLLQFIAGHTTPEDRHDLVAQLLSPTKPRDVSVQSFYYRLLELNSYVPWLPGTTAALTDDQLKQALYDSMPAIWKERFINAGKSPGQQTTAELLHYFRTQERQAALKQQENAASQRIASRKAKKHHPSRVINSTSTNNKSPSSRKNTSKSKDKKEKRQGSRVADSDPCPVHPGTAHTWGECFLNASNSNKKRRFDAKKSSSGDKKESHRVDRVDSPGDTNMTDCKSDVSCFIVESMVDLDTILTSHLFTDSFEKEYQQRLDTYLCESFNMTVEDCFTSGVTFNENSASNIVSHSDCITSLCPIGIMIADSINKMTSRKPLRVLFDVGSQITLINPSVLPPGATPKRLKQVVMVSTGAGSVPLKVAVTLDSVSFPEFSPTRKLDSTITAYVHPHTGSYDVILGNDVLVPAGIDPKPSTQTIHWGDLVCTWQPRSYFHDRQFGPRLDVVNNELLDNSFDSFSTQQGVKEILASKYDEVATYEVAQRQQHLSQRQREELGSVLSDFTNLFSGKLGCYPHTKVHLELLPDAKPFGSRPYPVPVSHHKIFREELDRLVAIGVLSPAGPAEFLSPTFIIPKKDGRVRWVSDFRKLNSIIKRKVYNLPKIQDILKKRNGYQFFTKLDISMQYYTFELDESSKDLCTICTPFGNYKYNRLPMGIKQSPDIAQQIMEDLFRRFEEVSVYIDDIGVFSNSWEDHLSSLRNVLTVLQENHFTVNPLKCEWAVQETDWLGYWLTPVGLKPWKKKIQSILSLQRPSSIKELRSFIGAVTFYRDMFPKRSHLLAPDCSGWTTKYQVD